MRARIALILVKNCRDCPFRDMELVGENSYWYCTKSNRKITCLIDKRVPSWCELEFKERVKRNHGDLIVRRTLRTLAAAYPDWITPNDISKRIGYYTPRQISKVLSGCNCATKRIQTMVDEYGYEYSTTIYRFNKGDNDE